MGWWSMTGAAAPALGLVAGGPLVDWLGWRAVFVLQALLSVGALALAALVLRETQRHRVRFDLAGAATLAAGVAGLMFALARSLDVPLLSPDILGGLTLGTLGIAAFVWVERRSAEPLMPLAYFRRRDFSAAIVSNASMGGAYMGAFVLAPLVLQGTFAFSISATALFMLMRTLSLTLASPVGGRLGGRIGVRASAVLGAGTMTVALVLIALGSLEASLPLFGLGLVLQGTGHGLALPSLTSAVAGAVEDRDLGIASAANRLTANVGTSFGITALSITYGGLATGVGFARAFGLGAILALVSTGSALCMSRPRPRRRRLA
jgi:MFS family permease